MTRSGFPSLLFVQVVLARIVLDSRDVTKARSRFEKGGEISLPSPRPFFELSVFSISAHYYLEASNKLNHTYDVDNSVLLFSNL